MGAQTDVKLVITAQDAASKAVGAITTAINQLVGAQDNLMKGAGETSSLLDQLKNASTALAAAVQKTDDAVVQAQAAFDRQQKTLAETTQQLAAVKAQMEAADAAAAALNVQIAAGGEGAAVYTTKLAAVAAEQKNLTAQANTLTRAIANQEAAMAKTGAALQQTKSTANVGGSAAALAVVTPAAVTETEKAAAASTRLANALRPIAPAAAEASQGTRSLWTQLKEVGAAMFAVAPASSAAGESVGAFGARSSAATQAAHLFRYELLSLAFGFVGPYGVVMAIGEVLKSYQDLQTAQNKLGVVFNQNKEQVGAQLDFLRALAVKLGLSFSTLADQYSMLAISAQGAGLSLGDTNKLFTAIAESARVLHLSTDDVNRVFQNFQVMMSKGVVQSVDLRKKLGTELPGAVKLFADALGVSEAQLNKMIKAGQVLADSDTMGKVADELIKKYGAQLPDALTSVQTQIGRLQVLLEISAQKVGQSGFMAGLTDALKVLNDELQSSGGQSGFAEIGQALGKIAGIIPFVVHNFGLITDALKAWVAVKIASWVSGAISSFVALSAKILTTIGELEAAALAAKAFWAAVSGIGILAAFGLETLLENWLTSIDDATTALEEHQKILDAVKKGYGDAGKSVDDWASKIKGATEVEALANLQKLQAALADIKKNLPSSSIDIAGFGRLGVEGAGTTPQATGLETQLDGIIQKFKDGKSSYEDFKKAISDFGIAHPQFADFILQVLDSTKKFDDLQASIKQANAVLDVMRGKATSTDLKTLGLDQADGWKVATNQLEKFHDALTKLGNLAPGIKRDLHFDDLLSQAQTDYAQAMKDAAGDPKLLAQAKAMYDKVVAQIHALAAKDAASDFPVDNKAIIERIIYVESRGNPNASPNVAGSHALGIGQFEPATWIPLFNELFPKLADMTDAAKLALRSNVEISTKILEELTRQNMLGLAKAGIPVTPTNTYLAQFLGLGTAITMIQASPDTLASKIASAMAVKANPKVLGGGQTAGDVTNWAQSVMGDFSPTHPLLSTGETELEKVNAALDDQIKKWQDDAKAMLDADAASKRLGDGAARALFIEKAVTDEATKFRNAGGLISPDQIASIQKYAGALYDVQHAAQDAKKAVDDVIGLAQERTNAIKELQTAFQDGSSSETIDLLKKKVADLTAQILAMLPAARAAADSLADPKVVAALDKAIDATAKLKTGLTDAKDINVKLADGLSSAWGSFVSTLGQSSKILVSLRNAFLQFAQTFLSDISQMILKQIILNQLRGTNIGNSLAGFINGASGTDAPLVAAEGVNTTATAANTVALTANTAALSASGSAGGLGGILSAIFAGGSPSLPGYGAADLSLINELPVLHSGGIVGRDGTSRMVATEIFAAARRFHSGGLPGLALNEIPAILQRGEEVLTRNDPRHIFNGGGGSSPLSVKIVNAVDAGDFLSKALDTAVGQRAIINHIRANKSAMRVALNG